MRQLWILCQIPLLLLAACSSNQRLSEMDPSLFSGLRGYIHTDKSAYTVGDTIAVEYWLTNLSGVEINEAVVDGSQQEDVPFQGYHFNAIASQNSEQHLGLKEPGIPISGDLQMKHGEKKRFVANLFMADQPGSYVLSFELRWRNRKRVVFKPVTVAVQAKKADKPKTDSVVDKALLQLASADHRQRREAREAILQFGSQAAPALIEILGLDDVALRSEAMLLLIAMKKDALPTLLRNAQNQNREIRMRVIYAIGEIGEISALEVLSQSLLKDEDKGIRLTALRALAKYFVDRIVIPLLIAALEDSASEVRAEAIEAIRNLAPAALEMAFEPNASELERQKSVAQLKRWWRQHEEEKNK